MSEETGRKAGVNLERLERGRRTASEFGKQYNLPGVRKLLANYKSPMVFAGSVNQDVRKQTSNDLNGRQQFFQLGGFNHGRAAVEIVRHGNHREQQTDDAYQRDAARQAFSSAGLGDQAETEGACYSG